MCWNLSCPNCLPVAHEKHLNAWSRLAQIRHFFGIYVMKFIAINLLFFCVQAVSTATNAQPLDRTQEILRSITDAAKDVCATLPLMTSESKVQLSADATAKLAGLAKKLSDLGVSGAASYTRSDSARALLEADVLPALKDQNSCRLHVFDKLESKLLAPPPANSKVSVWCDFPKPNEVFQVAVEWNDADSSYIFVDERRVPGKGSVFGRSIERKIVDHSDTKIGWCATTENFGTMCYSIIRPTGKIFVYEGEQTHKPEAIGSCERLKVNPITTKF